MTAECIDSDCIWDYSNGSKGRGRDVSLSFHWFDGLCQAAMSRGHLLLLRAVFDDF
jgi:hypothetical protein